MFKSKLSATLEDVDAVSVVFDIDRHFVIICVIIY